MPTITIVNKTTEAVRCALFRKPVLQPTLATIAWRIVEPPPNGGQTIVQIPADYAVFANYSLDPVEREDANAGNRTNILTFTEYTARFQVNSAVSQDQRATAATIAQSFDDLVMNEVRLENNYGYGVWGHITKDGVDVFAPQVVWPGGILMEDLRATFYVAVVSQFVFEGGRLVDAETSLTETPVLEGGTLTVTGSMWNGYAMQ